MPETGNGGDRAPLAARDAIRSAGGALRVVPKVTPFTVMYRNVP